MADYRAMFTHPLTILGAGIMAGSDPRRTGLGGIGHGILGLGEHYRTQDLMAQQAEEAERRARMQDLQAERLRQQMGIAEQQQELAARRQTFAEQQAAQEQAAAERQAAARKQFMATLPEAEYLRATAFPDEFAESLYREPKRPSLQQNIEYMMSLPLGSPERAIAEQSLTKPMFQMMSAPPAGHQFVEGPGGETRVERIPGFKTAQEETQIRKINIVQDTLDEFEKAVRDYKPGPIGRGTSTLRNLWQATLTDLGQAVQEGAVTEDEQESLKMRLGNPTDLFSGAKSAEDYAEQIGIVRRTLVNRLRRFGVEEEKGPGQGPRGNIIAEDAEIKDPESGYLLPPRPPGATEGLN